MLKATSRLLSCWGWKIESFTDPILFLCHAQRHHPDVAVIDVSMPVLNGLQVQAYLRNLSPTTRVIVLTGRDDPAVRTTALKAGASGFFLKPVCNEEILAGIQSAFSEA
jgi:FixJ family two-component response regulator